MSYALLRKYQQVKDCLSENEQREIDELLDGITFPSMPLSSFVKRAWHVVEPHTDYQHNWHIDVISNHLEASAFGIIRNLLINIQPRHMKSLLVSVFFPCWVWSFAPHTQWLFLSHAQSLSIRDNLKRRRILKSRWYQSLFSEQVTLSGDQSQKSWFENSESGHMIALGLGGIGLGGDFIVGDDILNREHAFSQKRRDHANSFWGETVSTRGNNPKSVIKIIIAQRLHQDDPIGNIMELEGRGGDIYEKLIIPTEFEPDNPTPETTIGWRDPRKSAGELLWKKRFNRSFISTLKVSLGSMGSSSQLQQRPSVAGGNIFKATWWKFWQPEGLNLPDVKIKLADGSYHNAPVSDLPLMETIVQSWDMSFKEVEGTSYVVGQVWGQNLANYYLLDQERDRMGLPKTLMAVRRLTERNPEAVAKYIEEKANGAAVIQTLKSEIAGLIPVNPMGDKVSRANAVSPIVESGNVYLPHPAIAPWIGDFIDECRNFPAAVYNDQVDSFTQALLKLTEPKEKPKKGGAWGRKR